MGRQRTGPQSARHVSRPSSPLGCSGPHSHSSSPLCRRELPLLSSGEGCQEVRLATRQHKLCSAFVLGLTQWTAGGHHGEGVTYAGLTLHKPARWHVLCGEAFGGIMWFWILYRGYHDWNVFAVRM